MVSLRKGQAIARGTHEILGCSTRCILDPTAKNCGGSTLDLRGIGPGGVRVCGGGAPLADGRALEPTASTVRARHGGQSTAYIKRSLETCFASTLGFSSNQRPWSCRAINHVAKVSPSFPLFPFRRCVRRTDKLAQRVQARAQSGSEFWRPPWRKRRPRD